MSTEQTELREPWKTELEITLTQVTNLNRAKCKDAGWSLIVRALIINGATAETPKMQISSLVETLNQKFVLSLTIQSYQDLDHFVHYPLLLNFYDIAAVPPKDKKKPTEDKLDLLGQSSIDTLPFLNGAQTTHATCNIFPPGGTEGTLGHTDNPECKISISLLTPLIPPDFEQQFNLLTLTVHSCYSMPESWLPAAPAHGAQKNAAIASSSGFTFATAFPKNGAVERTLIANSKAITQKPNLKNTFKKWPSHPLIVSDAIYMSEKLRGKNYVLETGSFCSSTDWMHREIVERVNPCITVNTEFRCILPSDGELAFCAKAKARKVWPVELFELTLPEKHAGGKKKANTEALNLDEPVISRHGVAYVDIKPLLFPGATRIQGAFAIRAYDANEFSEKTHRVSIGADVARNAVEPSVTASLDTKETRLSVGSKNRSDFGGIHELPDKTGSNNPKSTQDILNPQTANQNAEQRKYEESLSYVYLEMKVERPLVSETPKKPIIDRLEQLIRPPQQVKKENDPKEVASLAEQAIQEEMESIYKTIAKSYASYIASCKSSSSDSEDCVNFIQNSMTAGGDFHAFKEQMKLHIIQLARNKYGLTASILNDPASFCRFLSTLYGDLMLQARMTVAAIKRSTYQTQFVSDSPHNTSELRMLALEAEMDDDTEEAERSMVKRTTLSPKDYTVWKDLGQFYMRYGQVDKAESTFLECLLDDYSNFEGLMCMGHCKLVAGHLDQAQTYFESVSILYPDSPLGWVALGLFYECCSHDSTGMRSVLMDLAYHNAKVKLGLEDKRLQSYEEFLKIVDEQHGSDIPAGTADPSRLIPSSPTQGRPKSDMEAKLVPSTAPKGGLKKDNKGIMSGVSQADSDRTREPVRLETNFSPISPAVSMKPKRHVPSDNIFWSALGSLVGLGLDQLSDRCISEHLITSCDTADPVFWRAAVLSKMAQNKLTEAENVLESVLLLDVETADVFALLGHVKYMQKDFREAAANFDRALSLSTDISDPFPVYFRYGRLAENCQWYEKAYEMFFLAMQLSPSCQTWLGIGRACYYQELYGESERALQEANRHDDKNPVVWAYLAMVNVKFDRKVTAESGQVRYIRWFDTKIMPTDMEDRRRLIVSLLQEIQTRVNDRSQDSRRTASGSNNPEQRDSSSPDPGRQSPLPNSPSNIQSDTDGYFVLNREVPNGDGSTVPINVVYLCTPENIFALMSEATASPFVYLDALYESVAAIMACFKLLQSPADIMLTFQFQKLYAIMDQMFVAGRIRSMNEIPAICERMMTLDILK